MLYLQNNWLKSGWVDSHSGLSGAIFDDGGNLIGDVPGFVDAGNQDFHLTHRSPCLNAGAALPPEADAVTYQYVKHQCSEVRPSDGKPDLGAFELRQGPRGLSCLGLLLD